MAAGESLDEQRVDEEMLLFETGLEQQHGRPLDFIIVDDVLIQQAIAPDVTYRVDLETRTLVPQ